MVAGALILLDQGDALKPYLPKLSPSDRERVNIYIEAAEAARRCTPTGDVVRWLALLALADGDMTAALGKEFAPS